MQTIYGVDLSVFATRDASSASATGLQTALILLSEQISSRLAALRMLLPGADIYTDIVKHLHGHIFRTRLFNARLPSKKIIKCLHKLSLLDQNTKDPQHLALTCSVQLMYFSKILIYTNSLRHKDQSFEAIYLEADRHLNTTLCKLLKAVAHKDVDNIENTEINRELLNTDLANSIAAPRKPTIRKYMF